MAEPYTDEELARVRARCANDPLISLVGRFFATIDAHDAAHRQEIAERDARIAELEDALCRLLPEVPADD